MVLGKIAENIYIFKKKRRAKHKRLLKSTEHSEQNSHITSQYQWKEQVYSYRANNALAFPSNHCCASEDTATETFHCTSSIDYSLISIRPINLDVSYVLYDR
jgi:hypothetical protein